MTNYLFFWICLACLFAKYVCPNMFGMSLSKIYVSMSLLPYERLACKTLWLGFSQLHTWYWYVGPSGGASTCATSLVHLHLCIHLCKCITSIPKTSSSYVFRAYGRYCRGKLLTILYDKYVWLSMPNSTSLLIGIAGTQIYLACLWAKYIWHMYDWVWQYTADSRRHDPPFSEIRKVEVGSWKPI